MARKERPVAVIAPSMRNITLYANGRIDYRGQSGSVIGATARIESTGEKNRLRDTRKVVLRIEGPNVAIAAPLPPASIQVYRQAQQFVAQVNEISGEADGSTHPPGVQAAADPPQRTDASMEVDSSARASEGAREAYLRAMDVAIAQLERLGRLRDSGVLTEDEFQEQKAALLRATRSS